MMADANDPDGLGGADDLVNPNSSGHLAHLHQLRQEPRQRHLSTSKQDQRSSSSSDFAKDMLPSMGVILAVIGIFIVTTIIYLHTTSAPALTYKAVRLQIQSREQFENEHSTDPHILPLNESLPGSYLYSSPRANMCFFQEKLTRRGMPTLHSVFADPISHNVVINGVRLQNTDWRGDDFVCQFENSERVASDPVVHDDRSFGYKPQYLIVITCPIPRRLYDRTNFTMSLYRKVGGTFSNEFSYQDITVCLSGSEQRQRRFLTMCTMLKDADEFIGDWLDFHLHVGVDHVFIYDNQLEELSKLRTTVAEYIDRGVVTVIPWAHTPTSCKIYLEVQIAHENDCLWRNRHTSKWMLKIDVDEYVQPMNASKPFIGDYLRDPLYDRVGAVRLQNWFFGRPNLSEPQGGKSLVQRNPWRAREPTEPNASHDKNILRPINVHYFKIHAMKLGGTAVTIDPWTELRMVHYRGDNPRRRNFRLPKFNVLDTSMVDMMDKIAKLKQGLT
ncbi:beta-1,4-galactosyltransferase galt-1-like [Diadema antillarum]|uniref:beta-1,4-galactosyltransferase galt-1-like n=1 Tax=Diadema antillarum TaxID=105358 RepID=UPI003A89D179